MAADRTVTEDGSDLATFVEHYARLRHQHDSEELLRLHQPDGALDPCPGNGPTSGSSGPVLNDLRLARVPGLNWELLGWAARGETLYLEWRCQVGTGEDLLAFDGVDRLVVRHGKIVDGAVYMDTAPLWAIHDPSVRRPLLRSAELLAG
jgi:hypothetical protein